MAESTQQPSSSDPQATQRESPPRDRVVVPKRFNPRQRLEEKMRQRMQREAEAGQPAPEQMPPGQPTSLGRGVPTMLVPVQVPVSKYVAPQRPPRRGGIIEENALTTRRPRTGDWAVGERSSRICCTESPLKTVQTDDSKPPLQYRTVMNKRFSQLTALEEKLWQRVEKRVEAIIAPPLRDQNTMQNPQQPVTQYSGHPGEENDTVPRHLPRREPTVELDDFTSQLQDSNQKNRLDPQSPVRRSKSSILMKKPVLARWPHAFTDFHSDTGNQTATLGRTVWQKKPAPRVDMRPERPEHFRVSTGWMEQQTVSAELPVARATPSSVATISRARSAVEPMDYYQALNKERRLLQKNIPPAKPSRKSLIKPEVDAELQHQLFSDGAAAAEVSEYSLPSKQEAELLFDEFCTSASVARLTEANYKDFLGDKTSALVMFYKPWKQSCVKGRKHFVKAAESNQRKDSAFGAVDCSKDASLCLHEDIISVPTFKLYSQGQLVNTIKDFIFFNSRTMKKFVEKTPALTQVGVARPACRTEQSWLKKAIHKLTF